MLKEALHEFLHREGTLLELPGIGGAVLECDLRGFHLASVLHPHQTAIAESHAVDIGCQVTQSSLPVTHCLAMHHPVLSPDFGGDLCEEGCFAQELLEASAE